MKIKDDRDNRQDPSLLENARLKANFLNSISDLVQEQPRYASSNLSRNEQMKTKMIFGTLRRQYF